MSQPFSEASASCVSCCGKNLPFVPAENWVCAANGEWVAGSYFERFQFESPGTVLITRDGNKGPDQTTVISYSDSNPPGIPIQTQPDFEHLGSAIGGRMVLLTADERLLIDLLPPEDRARSVGVILLVCNLLAH